MQELENVGRRYRCLQAENRRPRPRLGCSSIEVVICYDARMTRCLHLEDGDNVFLRNDETFKYYRYKHQKVAIL